MTLEIWPANPEPGWRLVTDAVMGGVSRGTISHETIGRRPAMRMQGDVSTDNNGGFIQITLDLAAEGGWFDAAALAGVAIDVFGNGEVYGAHVRTTDLTRPQQSYRQSFCARAQWQTLQLPFAQFTPHRTDVAFDPRRLRRIGLVAIGRAFSADLSVARLAFY
jgi:hypothetical protein